MARATSKSRRNITRGVSRIVLRPVFRLLIKVGWYEPILQILARAIKVHPLSKSATGAPRVTLLALSPEGFRGDLDALAGFENFQVLIAPTHWQTRLMYLFYPEGLRIRDYMNPAPGSAAMACKQRLQAFYRELLPRLYKRLGIECVISYHIRLPADVDWGMASRSTGFPYVVLYREGLFASSPRLHQTMATLFGRFGFWGTHLIVHNESCRQLCIDTGLAPPEKVSALGCLRMDRFIRRIQQHKPDHKRRKRVALFPISLKKNGEFDLLLMPFFEGVHVGLAKLAMKYPDVDFVMKPKPKVYKGWRILVDQAFAREGIEPASLGNLTMDPRLDAQDLILESDVVCGINSTTLLEAGLAAKPVVVPYFNELRQLPYRNSIKFVEGFQYFDVAADADSFIALIEKRLADPEISQADMDGRRKMFAKYVSDPDGNALEKYAAALAGIVSAKPPEELRGLPMGDAGLENSGGFTRVGRAREPVGTSVV
jgi:hypothetical protein